VVGVQIVRFFVLDVLFVRSQGHRAPALLHVVVALTLYFTTSGFGGSDPLKLDAPVTDTWVKVDGEWWYVEPR
jgi:hypothetical protein